MERFVEGEDHNQVTLVPECLDEFVVEDNPVRISRRSLNNLILNHRALWRKADECWLSVLSPICSVKDLYLWLSEPRSLKPAS